MQVADISYGIGLNGGAYYFDVPTPGRVNNAGVESLTELPSQSFAAVEIETSAEGEREVIVDAATAVDQLIRLEYVWFCYDIGEIERHVTLAPQFLNDDPQSPLIPVYRAPLPGRLSGWWSVSNHGHCPVILLTATTKSHCSWHLVERQGLALWSLRQRAFGSRRSFPGSPHARWPLAQSYCQRRKAWQTWCRQTAIPETWKSDVERNRSGLFSHGIDQLVARSWRAAIRGYRGSQR